MLFLALQEAYESVPTNPVNECDAINGSYLAVALLRKELSAVIHPSLYSTRLRKAWGWAVYPTTTPTTGKLQPMKDAGVISNAFTAGSKQKSIVDFNSKQSELDADVFSEGAMLRWLDPSAPNTGF